MKERADSRLFASRKKQYSLQVVWQQLPVLCSHRDIAYVKEISWLEQVYNYRTSFFLVSYPNFSVTLTEFSQKMVCLRKEGAL